MTTVDSKPDKLIVVVHGVGDPQPGETLSLFARSLADAEHPLVERQKITWLAERSQEDLEHIKTFPVHQRRIKFHGQTMELCEAFWGDLSRVRRGWLGVVQGIFQILFGLRYVAYVAADQHGRAARLLKRLGLLSSRILHGPVLAITFYLTLLMIAVCITEKLWPSSFQAPIWTQVVLCACAGFACLAASFGTKLTRSRVVERFWFWVNVTTMYVTGLMFVKSLFMDPYYEGVIHECPIHPGLLWYCRILLVMLGWLWFVEIQFIVAMAVCWAVACFHPRAYRPALHVAFLLPALAVGIWGQALPMVWLAAKEGIAQLAQLDEFRAVFDDAVPFLGVQLVMVACILVALAIVVIRYFHWRSKVSIESFLAGRRAPRLIVNGSLQLMLAFCTAVGVVLVSSLCLIPTLSQDNAEFPLGQKLAAMNTYAVSALVPLGGLLFFVVPRLRPGFDMLLDVINHFYFRPTNVQDVLDDDDEFDMGETTFENGTMFFSRRDALHTRVKRILSHYREEFDHFPELVIVSHSQGTMVAIEVLNDTDFSWLNNTFGSVTLVTMGSPLHHLYQHYFGHCYPPLSEPFWSNLKRRTDRWINICRIDDFVGTVLEFPSGATPAETQCRNSELSAIANPSSATTQGEAVSDRSLDTNTDQVEPAFFQSVEYSNRVVGARGHVAYWSDREVLDILQAELFEQPKPQSSGRSKAA